MFSSIDEALKALVPFVVDANNNLWDAGLLFLSKDDNNEYQVELTGFYYESEDEKEFGDSYEQEKEISINTVMISVFDYLQLYYQQINPSVKWNKLILEVNAVGKYTPHYEMDDEEVSPDAPAMPETITASYLAENLKNCLAHNAPNTYEWIWEVLERKISSDGSKSIGGNFFYSTNLDKSNPQKLEPGEYIYMYNVSERLFDEFLLEQTKGWTKIKLEFAKNGTASYVVLE